MVSEPGRARLLWAILSLVLPVMVGYPTACCSPVLAFSAMIQFTMKRSSPCSAVLHHYPSSWAAVFHCWALMPRVLRSSRRHPIHYFSCPPHAAHAPYQFSENHALRQFRVFHRWHESCEKDSPPAQNRLAALPSRLDEGVQRGNRVSVRLFFRQPMQRVRKQEAAVCSAQCVVEARAWAPRGAAVQHCYLEYLGSKHPEFELEGNAWSAVQQ